MPSEDSDQPGHPLCAQWVTKGPSFHHADGEDYDQTGRMHSHFVGIVMSRLICNSICISVVDHSSAQPSCSDFKVTTASFQSSKLFYYSKFSGVNVYKPFTVFTANTVDL